MTFQTRIKELRGPLSQAKFAKKIGVSTTTIQNYESGDIPKGDILQRIHKEFGVDLTWLLTGEGDSYSKGSQEGLVAADGEGLFGKTKLHKVDGDKFTVTEFSPPGTQPPPDVDDIDEAFDKAVGGLRRIFNSGDPVLISAIRSNIMAFERAALKDHNLHEQSKRIQKLEDECKALKKGLSDLRKPT